MTTTLFCFDFICTQPVPFYQHLCNQLLSPSDPSLQADLAQISIDNRYLKNGHYRYRIEAQGTQAQLEALADRIAHDFLLSVHLVKTNIAPLEQKQGNSEVHALPNPRLLKPNRKRLFKAADTTSTPHHQLIQLDYCASCAPLLGDNQSPQFGQIELKCPCCHGEAHYQTQSMHSLTKDRLLALAQTLLAENTATIDELGITLSTQDTFHQTVNNQGLSSRQSAELRPQILVCNPNTLSQYFNASHEQVITLSCFEKPAISLTTKADAHADLDYAARCDVRFAYNRALIIITEYLRQKGIDWVFYRSVDPIPKMAFIDQHWIWLQQPHDLALTTNIDSLHDNAIIGDYQAQMLKNRLYIGRDQTLSGVEFDTTNAKSQAKDQAFNAFYAAQLAHGSTHKKDTATLFFSRSYLSQLLTSNRIGDNGRIEKDKPQSELQFPLLPDEGSALIQQLRASIAPSIEGNLLTEHNVIDKFQAAYPAEYAALSQLTLAQPTQNLTSLLVIAATILGLSHPHTTSDNQRSVERLLAHASRFKTEHSARIDFPKQEIVDGPKTHNSFDWCQSFKSLMSFCLAEHSQQSNNDDNGHISALAFGFLDSLADEISQWIEQADNQVGIKNILLAGDEFQYDVFTRRLCRRLAANYSIHASWSLDLQGANLAAGALYLPQRRAFS
ncbi:hypothetical protein HC723_12010 [Vibrio sp. S11_S32]|uniref:hypothetical protein n=1 Tax=Vibrio sp. S11_S32 TaxID=2720225 RepID=UPI00168191B8|nr:hypothetical protein [Vibrio sp. S11_S32]MBD1577158.1 hypothetical protein [Vibrio sp. S11_S32]